MNNLYIYIFTKYIYYNAYVYICNVYVQTYLLFSESSQHAASSFYRFKIRFFFFYMFFFFFFKVISVPSVGLKRTTPRSSVGGTTDWAGLLTTLFVQDVLSLTERTPKKLLAFMKQCKKQKHKPRSQPWFHSQPRHCRDSPQPKQWAWPHQAPTPGTARTPSHHQVAMALNWVCEHLCFVSIYFVHPSARWIPDDT